MIFRKKCTCGSGAHPRRCNEHPWAYQQHIAELNHDNLYERVCDLEDEVKKLKEDIEKLNKKLSE